MFSNEKIALIVILSTYYAFSYGWKAVDGVFFLNFQDEFVATASEISTVCSLGLNVMRIGGPLYGVYFKLLDGKWTMITSGCILALSFITTSFAQSTFQLALTFGFMGGIGAGLAYICMYTIASQVYNKTRSLVTNFGLLLSALVSAMLSPIILSLLDEYGLRGTVLIIGGLLLNLVPIGWVCGELHKSITTEKVKNINPSGNSPDTAQEYSNNFQVLKSAIKDHKTLLVDPLFLSYCFANALLHVAKMVPSVYLVRSAQDVGISNKEASILLSAYFAVGIPCLLITGVLSSSLESNKCTGGLKIEPVDIITWLPMIETFVFFIPVVNDSFVSFLIYACLVGICNGSYGAATVVVLADFFGTKHISLALGVRGFVMGIFALAIVPLIGVWIDVVGNYKPVQYVCAMIICLTTFLMIIIRIGIRKRRNNISHGEQKNTEIIN